MNDFISRFYFGHFRTCLTIGLVVGISVFASSCRQEAPPETIKIGLIAYLQGDDSQYYDYPTLYGCQLALENIEQSGGLVVNGRIHPIELLIEEISPNPEQAVIAARKLINRDGVVALIGPQYSSDAIPVGGIAEAARVPMISPSSTHPDTTKERRFVFRMSFLDDLQGKAMALFAYKDLQVRKAAILFNEAEPYSQGISAVFRRSFSDFGGEIVADEAYATGDEEFSRQLQAVKMSGAEVLYLPVFQDELERLVMLARKKGVGMRLLGADTWEQDKLRSMADFNGSYMTNSWNNNVPGGQVVVFVDQYVERFKSQPNGDSALTYDAVQVIFEAIKAQQDFSPEAIQQGLYQLEQYSGVTGTIDFVDSGDPEKDVVIMYIDEGNSSYFKTITSKQLKAER